MRERVPKFQAVPGLLQKYYTHDESTGDWCGIYLWESEGAIETFRASDLARTIATAYQIIGQPRIEQLMVHLTLRE